MSTIPAHRLLVLPLAAAAILTSAAPPTEAKSISRREISSGRADDRVLAPGTTFEREGSDNVYFSGLIEQNGSVVLKGLVFTTLDGVEPQTDGAIWFLDGPSHFTYEISLRMPEQLLVETSGIGTMHLQGVSSDLSEPRVFETERLAMDLSGDLDPATTFLIRESTTLASTGTTIVENLPGGLFNIDSTLDIELEMGVDGGAPWYPAVALPEPTAGVLAAPAGVALTSGRRRA